jgi:hypothetical protein
MPRNKSDLPFSKDCSKIANARRNVLVAHDLKEPLSGVLDQTCTYETNDSYRCCSTRTRRY